MTDGEEEGKAAEGPGPVPVPPTPAQGTGQGSERPLSQAGGIDRMCHFCHEIYQGSPRECPKCGRTIPRIPTG